MLADENVEAHETHFLVVWVPPLKVKPPWVNFLYGPSGSGELKIKAKNGSEMVKKMVKICGFVLSMRFMRLGCTWSEIFGRLANTNQYPRHHHRKINFL